MESIALLNLRHLRNVVRQREEALKVAQQRLEKAQRELERAIEVATVPGLTPKQLRELMK